LWAWMVTSALKGSPGKEGLVNSGGNGGRGEVVFPAAWLKWDRWEFGALIPDKRKDL